MGETILRIREGVQESAAQDELRRGGRHEAIFATEKRRTGDAPDASLCCDCLTTQAAAFAVRRQLPDDVVRAMVQIRHKVTGAVLLEVEGDSLANRPLIAKKLMGANLAGLDLSGSNLSNSDLRETDMTGATLERTVLNAVGLNEADLSHANLTGADFTDSRLEGADFSYSCMHGANLRYCKAEGAIFIKSDLTGADLSMADLRGNLQDAILKKADLRGANLMGANMIGCNLEGASLKGAIMTCAHMSHAKVRGMIDVYGNRKIDSDLEGAAKSRTKSKSPMPKTVPAWWQFWKRA
jgi:uncharacterized protein YjbI with pentapeptide repeats